MRVVFKHYPLNFHANARPAALAAIAAQMQGKFWPYHDLLFHNAKKLGDADLQQWARIIGLDLARFNADRQSPAAQKQLKRDMSDASRIGVRGTPSIYLNGRKVKASLGSADAIVNLVKSEILKIE